MEGIASYACLLQAEHSLPATPSVIPDTEGFWIHAANACAQVLLHSHGLLLPKQVCMHAVKTILLLTQLRPGRAHLQVAGLRRFTCSQPK